ncbi:MAG: sulfatase [Myxococcota bacterium]|nr:sulfatase [Myxococcota bacterium]
MRRAAALLLLGALGCGPDASMRPDLVLITVDTLRADHVGVYGHHNDTTPTIDALAARGVRFDQAAVQWTRTWPSMASMLTGTYPATTGVVERQHRLVADNLTLAEVLGAAGYRTSAVVTNVNLRRDMGFDQGFDSYLESWWEELERRGQKTFVSTPGWVKSYTDATLVTDQALRWLAAFEDEAPFFLWLHYMDPHGPYDPPEGYEDRFQGTHPEQPVSWRELPGYQRRYGPDGLLIEDVGVYKARYDALIRYLDDQLARLVRALDALERPRPLAIALTADHGESLGEHDYYLEHGRLPYEPTARVPLLLVLEGRLPAGRVVNAPVGLVDLAPTLLELAGVEAPPQWEGQSLVATARGDDEGGPRPVFLGSGHGLPFAASVRHGPWKLVHRRSQRERHESGRPEFELFDLRSDPGEEHDVYARNPLVATALRAELAAWLERTPVRKVPPEQAVEGEALRGDPGVEAMLEALGYVEP